MSREIVSSKIEIDFNLCDPEDTFGIYLMELKKFPKLTPEENKELLSKAKSDKESRDLFYKSNLGLVVHVASKYSSFGAEILDLIQEGNIALGKAIDDFEPDFKTEFSTYAYACIRNKIFRYIFKKDKTVSLEDNPDGGSSKTYMDITPDRGSKSVESQNEEKYLKDEISIILARINKPRWKAILELRYGFRDGFCYSYDEISKILHLNRSRIEQIDKSLLKVIKSDIDFKKINDYRNVTKEKENKHVSSNGTGSEYPSGFLFAVEKLRSKFEQKERSTFALVIDDVPGISDLERNIFELKYRQRMSSREIRDRLKLTEHSYVHSLNSLRIKIFVADEDRNFENDVKKSVSYSKAYPTLVPRSS